MLKVNNKELGNSAYLEELTQHAPGWFPKPHQWKLGESRTRYLPNTYLNLLGIYRLRLMTFQKSWTVLGHRWCCGLHAAIAFRPRGSVALSDTVTTRPIVRLVRYMAAQHTSVSTLKRMRGLRVKVECGGEIHSDSAVCPNENGFKHGFLCIHTTPS